MRVLAVDPGYDRLGVAVLEKKTQEAEVLLFSACFQTDKQLTFCDRLHYIGTELKNTFKKYKPEAVAIETIFFNKNVKTAVAVAETRGVVQFLAKERECAVYEFGPQEIKVAVTGYGKSNKEAVIDMIKRLVPNAPDNALDDEYDAIAVGVTCLAHHANRYAP